MVKTATQLKPGTDVATRQSPQLPSELAELARGDAGKGVSTRQEDNLVPLIYVLQALSPQVDSNSPAYIEGAKNGDIWLRNTADPIVDGKEGVWFQPCFFTIDWVEWMPDRGGFVARHSELPAEAKRVEDPKNPNRVKYVMPNNNEVVETRNHVGFVYNRGPGALPYVIPLSSTGHTFSRAWMFTMGQKRQAGGEEADPSWLHLYRLRTVQKQNAKGKWYMYEVVDSTPVPTSDDYLRGKALHEAFAKGERQAEAPVQTDHDEASVAEAAGL